MEQNNMDYRIVLLSLVEFHISSFYLLYFKLLVFYIFNIRRYFLLNINKIDMLIPLFNLFKVMEISQIAPLSSILLFLSFYF